jgi:superoxide dismutase, Fe-Mn family
MAYSLPPLPYSLDALEPFYDKATLEVHHGKHHATYVEKLNAAIGADPYFEGKPIEDVLANLDAVPQSKRRAVINHGGGHANHSLFWITMGPGKGGEPKGRIAEAIGRDFKSFADFKKQFNAQATDLFGSGWTFLTQDQEDKLHIRNLANQDSPISLLEKPLLLVDLWEHAYYLKWKNKRADWVETWWSLIDWDRVDKLYAEEPAWFAGQEA